MGSNFPSCIYFDISMFSTALLNALSPSSRNSSASGSKSTTYSTSSTSSSCFKLYVFDFNNPFFFTSYFFTTTSVSSVSFNLFTASPSITSSAPLLAFLLNIE